jgi:hypothetical protein
MKVANGRHQPRHAAWSRDREMEAPAGGFPRGDLVAGFTVNESLVRVIEVRPAETGQGVMQRDLCGASF